jgi:acrylyl-CoA reductase (NADPH)
MKALVSTASPADASDQDTRGRGPLVQTSLTEVPSPVGKDLPPHHLCIKVEYSSLNYKDALGVTGTGAIFKKLPMVGGIDLAGQILATPASGTDAGFTVGQKVVVTGCGLGEVRDGGYAEYAVEDAKNVVPLPPELSPREAMILGTAGFTAALALKRMEVNGQRPDRGPIVVTGASGGVGQFAVELFARRGYEVLAVSGKNQSDAVVRRLIGLGARRVLAPEDLEQSSRPLEKARFGGIVDNVGGKLLANLIPQVDLWGNVCCIGLAESSELHTTVMPLILRGVSLLGVSSNNTPWAWRTEIWQELATRLKPGDLEGYVHSEVGLEAVVSTGRALLGRQIAGRVIVRIS